MNRDDRMVQVSNEFAAGAPVVSYVYDAMGRRIVRKSATGGGSEWRMFFYDGLSVAAEKKSTNSGGSWSWDALYTLAPGVIGHVLAQSQWSGAAWVSTFLHYDHIGNVTLSTGPGGSPIDHYDQDAFGNPLTGPDDGLRLQTKELDADAGLHYFYQRWYDADSSRWISTDFLSIWQNYLFGANSPTYFIDPDGFAPFYGGRDLNWPECNFENLVNHSNKSGCGVVQCDSSVNLGAFINSIKKIIEILIGNKPRLTPDGYDPDKVSPGVTVGGIAYFNPKHPKVGGDFCAMLCVCVHEWIHAWQQAAGIQVPREARELPAYSAGTLCHSFFMF